MKKILASTWFNPGATTKTIGIVAVESDGGWNAYIGIVEGHDEKADEQKVADWGCKLPAKIAFVTFKHLDQEKFKG